MNLIKPTLRVIIFLHIISVSLSFGAEMSMQKKTTPDTAQTLKKSLTLAHVQALPTNTLNLRKKQEIEKFNDSLCQLHHGIKLFDEKREEEALPIFLSSLKKIEDNALSVAPKLEADIKHAIFCSTFALNQKPLEQYLKENPFKFSLRKENAEIIAGFSYIGKAYLARELNKSNSEHLNFQKTSKNQYLHNAFDIFNCNPSVSIACIAQELENSDSSSTASTEYKQKQLIKILKEFAFDGNTDAQSILENKYPEEIQSTHEAISYDLENVGNAQTRMGCFIIDSAYEASQLQQADLESKHLQNAYDIFKSDTLASIGFITEKINYAKSISSAKKLYQQKQLKKILVQFCKDGIMQAYYALADIFINKEYNESCSPDFMLNCGQQYILQFAKTNFSKIPHEHFTMTRALSLLSDIYDDAKILLKYLDILYADKKNEFNKAKNGITLLSPNKKIQSIAQLLLHTIPASTLQDIDSYILSDENLIGFFNENSSLLIALLEQKLAAYENCNAESDAFNRILGLYEFHHENFEKARQYFSQCNHYATDLYLQALCLKTSTSIQNFLNQFEHIVSVLNKSLHKQSDEQAKNIILAAVESFRKKYMATLSPAHTYQIIFCMEQLPKMQRAAYDELIAIEDIVMQETQKNYEKLLCNPHRVKLYEKLEAAAQKEHNSFTCKTLTKLKRIQTNSPWINQKSEMALNRQLINHVSCVLKHSDVHEKDKSLLKTYPERCIAEYMHNDQYNAAYNLILHLAQTPEMHHIAWKQFPIIEKKLVQETEKEYKKIALLEDRIKIQKMLETIAQKDRNFDFCKILIELNRIHVTCSWLEDKDIISLQENLVKHISSHLKNTDLPEKEKDTLRAHYTQCTATHVQNRRYSPAYHMIFCMAQLPEMQSTAFNEMIVLEKLLIQEHARSYEQLLRNAYRMQAYKAIENAIQKKSQPLPLKDLIELQYKHIERTSDEQSKITLQEKILRYTPYALTASAVSQEDINIIKECYKNYIMHNITINQYNCAYHMIFGMIQQPQMQQSAWECFQDLENKPFEDFESNKVEKNTYRSQILATLQRLYLQHDHASCICKTKTMLNALKISRAEQDTFINLKKARLEYLSCQRKHTEVSERDKCNLQLQHKKNAEEIAQAEESVGNYQEAIKYHEIVINDATNLLKNPETLEEYKPKLKEQIEHSTERIGSCALAIGIDHQDQGRNAQAIKWFDQAIQYGNPSALHAKAMSLRNNPGAKKKTQEIINLLLQHTKTNDAKNLKALSHDALGVYYFKSNDPINTFIHLKQAADFGCFSSTHALIQLLFDGIPEFLEPNNSLAMHYMNQTISDGNNIDHLRLVISRAFDLYQKNLHQEALEDIKTILLSNKSTFSEKADACWLNGMIELYKNGDITTHIVNHFRKADIYLKENTSLEQKSIANLLSVTLERDIIALCKKIQNMISLNRCDEDAFDFYFIVGKLFWEYADRNPSTAQEYKKIVIQGLECSAAHNHIGSQLWLLNAQDHEVPLCNRIYYLENSLQAQPKISQTIQPVLNKIYPKDILKQAVALHGLLKKSQTCAISFLTKLYRICLPAIEDTLMNQDEMDELIEAFLQKNIILDAAQRFRANPSTTNHFECFAASFLGNLLVWSANPKLLIQAASYLEQLYRNQKNIRIELANEIGINLGVTYFKLGLYYLSPTTYNAVLAIDFFKRATPYNNPGAMASLSELWLNKIPETQNIDQNTIYAWIMTAHNALNTADTLSLKQRYEKEYGCPKIPLLFLQKKKK